MVYSAGLSKGMVTHALSFLEPGSSNILSSISDGKERLNLITHREKVFYSLHRKTESMLQLAILLLVF